MKEVVIEICPRCSNECEVAWDTKKDSYHAFCPYCGERLMLCSECPATRGECSCDYNSQTDKCRMQKV